MPRHYHREMSVLLTELVRTGANVITSAAGIVVYDGDTRYSIDEEGNLVREKLGEFGRTTQRRLVRGSNGR